jgi:hypothetical protein
VSTAHELPDEAKHRLKELEILSQKAENGDKQARRELRRAVRELTPDVVAEASDLSSRSSRLLIKTVAADDPLLEEALETRLELMRSEIAGVDPTPLEVLLVQRVVACWLVVELFEVLMAAQLYRDNKNRVPLTYLKHLIRWQESAQCRYLSAIKELARVRKLQSNTPGIQVNTQINLGSERP